MSKSTGLDPIKPCPFCGKPAELITREMENYNSCTIDLYYDVRCTDEDCYLCDGAEWNHKTPEEAIEIWNKRPIND